MADYTKKKDYGKVGGSLRVSSIYFKFGFFWVLINFQALHPIFTVSGTFHFTLRRSLAT